MNKKIWIFAVIIILGLAIGIYIYKFYIYKFDGPTSKVNSELEGEYSALKNEDYTNFLVLEINEDLKKLEEITGGQLSYFIEEGSKEGFHCKDGREINRVQYSSYSMGRNIDGGWGGTSILDCEDYYYIFKIDDSGLGPIYGPFNK